MTRYFRASVAVYESICEQLDLAYGYPDAETGTLRTLPLAGELESDAQGRVYLCLPAEFCDYHLPAQMLPGLLASGAVEEIAAEEYQAVVQPTTP
jgi:hypothetical protein